MMEGKFIIYQILLRVFANTNRKCVSGGSLHLNGSGKFSDMNERVLESLRKFGATHIWYTGIIEHATATPFEQIGLKGDNRLVVKGEAGSPYAIKDYYDVNPYLADNPASRMVEFEAMVERTHKAGLKVILDFVPNHLSRVYGSDVNPAPGFGAGDDTSVAFSAQNNFYYLPGECFNAANITDDKALLAGYSEFPAKVTGNDCFTASPGRNDWYETVKLNYGVFYNGGGEKQFYPTPDTWHKMLDILLFWCGKGVDGFRCDMAEMVPVEFWQWVIPQVKQQYPEIIFIAEVYQPHLYRTYLEKGHFDYLYDKVGLYDTLRNVTSKNHAVCEISHCWQSLDDMQDKMLNFLENHDEQRIASGFYAGRGMYAQPAMIVAATLTKAPVMIYFGQELGELGMDSEGFSGVDGRTTIFDYWSVKSIQAWANNGKFDGSLLNEEQRELRAFYQKLLHITLNEKAITDGTMYDLEYAQYPERFNKHEQYTYIRKFKNELLLFALNFDDKQVDIDIHIPQEAFEYLNISQDSQYNYVNLLDEDEKGICTLSSDNDFNTRLDAWKGKIYKLTPHTTRKSRTKK